MLFTCFMRANTIPEGRSEEYFDRPDMDKEVEVSEEPAILIEEPIPSSEIIFGQWTKQRPVSEKMPKGKKHIQKQDNPPEPFSVVEAVADGRFERLRISRSLSPPSEDESA